LRQDCPEKCTHGLWPSFLDVRGADQDSWEALDKAQRTVEAEAKKGRRLEVWVTAVGQLRTRRRPGLDPCHRLGSRYLGYGHLGAYPAQLIVTQFRDIEVKVNPNSPYDYSNMYRGPL
jgi:hypothetical protein